MLLGHGDGISIERLNATPKIYTVASSQLAWTAQPKMINKNAVVILNIYVCNMVISHPICAKQHLHSIIPFKIHINKQDSTVGR